jgi:hypothetical protein
VDGRWAALYPPGWPLLLAGVRLLDVPFWLACPLAGIVLLFAVFKVRWMPPPYATLFF